MRKAVRFLTIAAASVFAIGLGTLWATYWLAARTYPDELRRAQALGLTLAYEELDPDPAVPAEDNAAARYAAAIARVPEVDRGTSEHVFSASLRSGPENWDALRHALASWADVLPDLEAAASLPRCRFEREWAQGAALAFPEFAELRRFSELLCAHALVSARDGDVEAAARSLRLAGAVGRHAGEEPVLIGLLVRLGIEARVLRTANLVLDVAGPGAIEPCRGVLASLGAGPELRSALQGETAFQYNAFAEVDRLEHLSTEIPVAAMPTRLLVRPPLVSAALVERAYRARMLARWCGVFEAQRDASDPRALGAALDRAALEVERSRHPSDVMGKLVFPVFSQAAQSVVRLEARKRLFEASLLVRQAQARDGAPPEAVSDLPMDPFDGKPLRYRREKEGFLLYSVDGDGKDDGGQERRTPGSQGGGTDLVLRVPSLVPAAPTSVAGVRRAAPN